jgi:hypothetical protein
MPYSLGTLFCYSKVKSYYKCKLSCFLQCGKLPEADLIQYWCIAVVPVVKLKEKLETAIKKTMTNVLACIFIITIFNGGGEMGGRGGYGVRERISWLCTIREKTTIVSSCEKH